MKERDFASEKSPIVPVATSMMRACIVVSPSVLMQLNELISDWITLPGIEVFYCFERPGVPGVSYDVMFPRDVPLEFSIDFTSIDVHTIQLSVPSISAALDGFLMVKFHFEGLKN